MTFLKNERVVMKESTVIIGGGQAAASCAFKLRDLGYSGEIKIISDESVLPYHRPPLSKKFIASDMPLDSLLIKPESMYLESNIEVLLDTSVLDVDSTDQHIVLNNGETISYSHLVFATGATPRKLPEGGVGDCSNSLSLKTLRDAASLKDSMVGIESLLVVGGGYIGLEVASSARRMGIEVSIVEKANRILGRVAAEETSSYLKSLHESMGVEIFESADVTDFSVDSSGMVKEVEINGLINKGVDHVVIGIGVIPNDSLAKQAGLDVDDGILVDHYCRTSDDSVYAIGDCAKFYYNGECIRLESVQNAIEQAEVAAMNICGIPSKYDTVPWFWSDQFGAKLQIAGLNRGYDQVIVSEEKGFSAWYFNDGRLLSVDVVNSPATFMLAKKLLKDKVAVSPSDVTNLKALKAKALS